MPIYKAPVEDVLFLLDDVLHYDRYNNLPGFADATPDLIAHILEEGAKFVEEVLQVREPVGSPFTHHGVQPLRALLALEVVHEQRMKVREQLLDPVQVVGVDQRQQELAELAVLVVDASAGGATMRNCGLRLGGGCDACGRTCHLRALLVRSRSLPRQENRKAPQRCGP